MSQHDEGRDPRSDQPVPPPDDHGVADAAPRPQGWPTYPAGAGEDPAAGGYPPYTAPQYGTAPDYGTPPAYGTSPGYGTPPDYATPPTYGTTPDYGSPTGYGSPQGYPSAEYGANPYELNPYQSTYGSTSPYGYPPVAIAHPQAAVSMILGIVGVAFCPPVGIGGLVLGKRARREIDAEPQRYSGRGMATAGFVLGIISTVFSALFVLMVLLGVVGAFSY
jgi:hypothetical protein